MAMNCSFILSYLLFLFLHDTFCLSSTLVSNHMNYNHVNLRKDAARPCIFKSIFNSNYRRNSIMTTAVNCSEQQWSKWTPANPPSADVHSFKAGALEMPIGSVAQRRSFPFSVLLLSSSIVSLWRSLFRGIHAFAFRPQWLSLYKPACLKPLGHVSFSLINLEEFINSINGKNRHKITDGILVHFGNFIFPSFYSC